MKVAVTGGTGLVGRFVVEGLVAEGHEVTVLSRTPPAKGLLPAGVEHRHFDLGGAEAAPIGDAEALVHAALSHEPGRYRGGEGADAPGFLSRNLGGTVALFRSAAEAGARRVVFLSSRAVYGSYPPGTRLTEDLEPRPDTLYGRVKREAEAALARMDGIASVSLRVTGVYGPPGPGRGHKWQPLFEAFLAGESVAPRAGTEVHGRDVAAAVGLFLGGTPRSGIYNVSDFVLDRADLLAEVARLTGSPAVPPPPADRAAVSEMATDRIRALGWAPMGREGLSAALAAMLGPEIARRGP